MPYRRTDTRAVGNADDAITDRWPDHTGTDRLANRLAIGCADRTVANRCSNVVCPNILADNSPVHRAHSVGLLPHRDGRARYVR